MQHMHTPCGTQTHARILSLVRAGQQGTMRRTNTRMQHTNTYAWMHEHDHVAWHGSVRRHGHSAEASAQQAASGMCLSM